MGTYLNPGNEAFARICKTKYTDKTGLIALINERIGSEESLICISRPRRFGKSYVAKMLAAYYDCTCDSHALFADKKIAQSESYETHLNKYNVITLDIAGLISEMNLENKSLKTFPTLIKKVIQKDLVTHGFDVKEDDSLNDSLVYCANKTQKQFIFIIDEWDAIIREADPETQTIYLSLLRSWFKNNNFTPKVVAAAYMTGILPIKKEKTPSGPSQSAISDFREYTMLQPSVFAQYFGFTEEEVQKICKKNNLDFAKAKHWYDGYTIGAVHSMYNPFSVMSAVDHHQFRSYWKRTSAAEGLLMYIDMDQDGLQDVIARLIAGESVEVDTDSFQNDITTFTCKDDVLTLLIHLGYLNYEEEVPNDDEDYEAEIQGFVKIPNQEVRIEFNKILRKATHKDLIALLKRSDQLLQDTLAGNNEAVAKAIQEVHETNYAPTLYNNEQALRYTVKMSYISCVDQYAKIEELPTGHGIADLVFVPKRRSPLSLMIIELKWNKGVKGAIQQIKDRNYQCLPKDFVEAGAEIVLVGIDYNTKTKKHTCLIEKVHVG